MNRFFLKIIFFYFFLLSYVCAQNITNIIIEGNKRISNETVIVLGQINNEDFFDNNKLNNVLKNLYETNFFDNVNIKISGNTLEIFVKENPIIEQTNFTGIKNKSIITKISDLILSKERTSFTKNNLYQDTIIIKNFLRSLGYYLPEVKTSTVSNEKLNSISVNFNIDTGNKAKIKKILFIGDKKIKDKKLLEIIASEEHKFWKFLSKKVYINQSLIDLDKRLILNYYKNQGFFKAVVLDSFAEFDRDGYFNLIFNINAGEKFYFNDFTLNLPDSYNVSDFKKIDKIFSDLKGEKYSINNLNLILDEIENIASLKLYDFIDANIEEKIVSNNKINFNFSIKDSKKIYVEKINIFGNYNTIEDVIRNQLEVDEGDPLNKLLYNKSINNIKALSFFNNVKFDMKNGSEENTKVIDITVEERPTGEIMLAAGIGTTGTTIAAGLNEKNFLGKGIDLTSDIELSSNGVKGKFIYSRPNFAYTDNTLSTSIILKDTDNLSDFGYKSTDRSFSIGTEFEQYENLSYSPEFEFVYQDLETNSNASKNLKNQQGQYNDIYFNNGFTYDLRNSSYNPSSGFVTSLYQKFPIISDNNELTNIISFTKYNEINDSNDMIGKASFYFKSINSVKSSSDVRVSNRAKIPYNRLRGFKNGKVGPIDNGDYIGGNYVSTLNFSTNLPFLLNTLENLDFNYFIDFANIWGVDYDKEINENKTLRSSTGISVDFITPIGPLNFSLTQPLSKNSNDQTENFRFNLGTTF
ncbi:outer membrane protein assembly factor BamA [Candidatus Pelagibacter sp.]|nr:outer membrane protein assembly factor BamA [Candidatus Pelagibacter sp.]